MKKKENLVAVLERMGYNPKYDDDGDVLILYQMKHVYFLLNEEDNYVSLMYPQFIDIEDGDESLTLAICNKMTRELKLAKVFVDQSFKTVSATCEFYYANDEALEYSIKKSLRLIGLMSSLYQQNREELTK